MSTAVNIGGAQVGAQLTFSTRRERRAARRRRVVTAREARLAARLARLDYKVSGETGALRVPTKSRIGHTPGRLNDHRTLPGKGWDRSGATYVVEAGDLGKLAKPVIHHQWRRLMEALTTDDTTE